jgi:hypothetical protein
MRVPTCRNPESNGLRRMEIINTYVEDKRHTSTNGIRGYENSDACPGMRSSLTFSHKISLRHQQDNKINLASNIKHEKIAWFCACCALFSVKIIRTTDGSPRHIFYFDVGAPNQVRGQRTNIPRFILYFDKKQLLFADHGVAFFDRATSSSCLQGL